MNTTITFYLQTAKQEAAAYQAITSFECREDMAIVQQVKTTRGLEEIVLSLMTSSAVLVLANALRDLALKRKIHVLIDCPDGTKLTIDECGKDISADEIVGYLTKGLEKKVEENHSEDSESISAVLKLQLDSTE